MRDEIIVKYIVEEASAAERREVKAWISASEENKKKYEQMLALWQKSEHLESAHPFNADAAWKKVQGRISAPAAALRVQKNPLWISKYWVPMAAAAVLLIVAGVFINRTISSEHMMLAFAKDSVRTLALSDGTQVTLKNGSLNYPEIFKGGKRKLELNGRAYFKVHRDEQKPFVITAGQTEITVLGTAFEVNSFNDTVTVKVTEGKVKFTSPDGELILVKGEQAAYAKGSENFAKTAFRDENTLSYASQKLEFNNTSMAEVARQMESLYGNKLLFSEAIANCKITSTFDHESFENALKVITVTLDLQVMKKGNHYYLSGKGCY